MRFVRRPGAREERSEVRERARRCRRRSLGRRSLSPRGRGLAPRGGGLDALMVTAPLGPSPRAGLRSPLPSRRSATGGRARRGSGRGRRRRVIRNRSWPRRRRRVIRNRSWPRRRRRVIRNRSWPLAGCRSNGLRRGRPGRRRGRGIRRGVWSDRLRSRHRIGLRRSSARDAREHQQKCGQRDDTEGGGPQEDAREAEATRRLPHPGLRLQDGWPSSWPVSQL